MQKINAQKELEKVIFNLPKLNLGDEEKSRAPTLLLHSCCAPCSSYVIEYLSNYFEITVFFYNPNIFPREEYLRRCDEQMRLIAEMPTKNAVKFLEGDFEDDLFYKMCTGLEQEKEGGQRCGACFTLRLKAAASKANELKTDYFATTLTISPLKNAQLINTIGRAVGEKYSAAYLPGDFKKKNGFKRSIELSREYGLYRQDYCGCKFSKKEREEQNSKEQENEHERL